MMYMELNIYIFLFCLISFTLSQESYKCNVFRCSQYNLEEGQCIFSHPLFANVTSSDNKVFDISLNCPSGTYCPTVYTKDNQTCTSLAVQNHLVDGEACKNNTNCASNICNNQKCAGFPPQVVCSDHTQCMTGYFCGKLNPASLVENCIAQKSSGEACESDYDCKNNLACHNNNGTKTCTPCFSLDDGIKNEGNILMCKNAKVVKGYCVSTKLNQNGDECLPNNGTLQTECSYNTTGLPDDVQDKIYKSKCQCSKAYSNRNFCQYETEHPQWQKLLNTIKEILNHDALNKHTNRRYDFTFDVRRMILAVEDYPQYKDVDNCAIDIEAGISFINFSLSALIALLLVIFI